MVKNMPVNAGATEDKGWIPELGRSPGKTNGNPLHYSCRDDPMDIGYSPWCHKESDMIQHAEASIPVCCRSSYYFQCYTEIFKYDVVPFVYFCLLPILLMSYPRKNCLFQCCKAFHQFFLLAV